MAKLIAITGTHGTGKTTLSFLLAAEYKKLGANVKIIQEVARSCPFPLNAEMIPETAHWIYFEHSKKELEASQSHDIVICDRTAFDSFVYAKYLDLDIDINLRECAQEYLHNYQELFYVRPDSTCISNDGIRSTDLKFQIDIDYLFAKYLDPLLPEEIKSSDIFKKGINWNISYP